MQVPLRVSGLLRPAVPFGVLLAVGFSTVVFGATPFLLDLVTEEYGVSLIAASMIGVGQLSGFVLGSWGAGRILQPRRRVFVVALSMAVGANLASALLPPFAILVALRVLSGLSLGLITWFGWVQVFGQKKGMADIAVMGPLAGIAAGPLVAAFAVGGVSRVFLMLGALATVPLSSTAAPSPTPPPIARRADQRPYRRPSRSLRRSVSSPSAGPLSSSTRW